MLAKQGSVRQGQIDDLIEDLLEMVFDIALRCYNGLTPLVTSLCLTPLRFVLTSDITSGDVRRVLSICLIKSGLDIKIY